MLPLIAYACHVLLHPVDPVYLNAVKRKEHNLSYIWVHQKENYDQRAYEFVDLFEKALFLNHADDLPEKEAHNSEDEGQQTEHYEFFEENGDE